MVANLGGGFEKALADVLGGGVAHWSGCGPGGKGHFRGVSRCRRVMLIVLGTIFLNCADSAEKVYGSSMGRAGAEIDKLADAMDVCVRKGVKGEVEVHGPGIVQDVCH